MYQLTILAVLSAAVLAAGPARASERRFTYVYESTTQPKGGVEYEQWVTWKFDKDIDSKFDRLEFRHELEFGLTDRFQIAVYLSDWRYQDGRSVDDDGVEWRNSAVEFMYALTDPVVDPLGLALYGEVKLGDQLFELEGKIIAQKNIGKWVFAWNGTLEAEWEGSNYSEDKGELAQTLGASYQINPSFLLGAELLHEIEYDDWSQWQDHVIYIGPNFSYRNPRWWVTVTPLFQITDVESEANYQVRAIFGFDF